MFKRVIPLLTALVLMLGLGAYWLLYFTGNNTEYAKGHRYLVTIKPGMTTADIADLLHKQHLVKDRHMRLSLLFPRDLISLKSGAN